MLSWQLITALKGIPECLFMLHLFCDCFFIEVKFVWFGRFRSRITDTALELVLFFANLSLSVSTQLRLGAETTYPLAFPVFLATTFITEWEIKRIFWAFIFLAGATLDFFNRTFFVLVAFTLLIIALGCLVPSGTLLFTRAVFERIRGALVYDLSVCRTVLQIQTCELTLVIAFTSVILAFKLLITRGAFFLAIAVLKVTGSAFSCTRIN